MKPTYLRACITVMFVISYGSLAAQDWVSYIRDNGTFLEEITMDLSYNERAPYMDLPYLIWVYVKLKEKDRRGFAKETSENDLYKLQYRIEQNLSNRLGCELVGYNTNRGWREYYFYCRDVSYGDMVIARSLENIENYKVEPGFRDDPGWAVYFDYLYPTDREIIQIFNDEYIDRLVNARDKIGLSREIRHQMYFHLQSERDSMIAALDTSYYYVSDTKMNEKFEDYPYFLLVSVEHPIDAGLIEKHVFHLYDLCHRFNGYYDRWKTDIIKND